jgi:hypothetical protein
MTEMSERPPGRGASEVAFELHGVRVAVSAPDDDDLAGVLASLPPEATPCPPESAQQRFAVVSQDGVG